MWLHKMVKSGYPFDSNDLDLEVWEMLGSVAVMVENIRERRMMLLMAPKSVGIF